MFDSHKHESNTEVHVEVKAADAADAARLYGELLEKAKTEAGKAAVVRLGAANEVRFLKASGERMLENDRVRLRLLFSVNGRHYDIEVEEDAAPRQVAAALLQSILHKFFAELGRV